MSNSELKSKIELLSIPVCFWNITGDFKKTSNATTIEYVDGKWRVYECNERNHLESSYWFDSENIANDFFYSRMVELHSFLKSSGML